MTLALHSALAADVMAPSSGSRLKGGGRLALPAGSPAPSGRASAFALRDRRSSDRNAERDD
jgi:hypothetical protein